MTAYLKIDSIKGNVTTSGHEGSIECLSANLSIRRNVNSKSGIVANRSAGTAGLGELYLTKLADKSSTKFFECVGKGTVLPKVTLTYCQTSGKVLTYSKHVLYDVIVTSYNESYDDILEHPVESVSLNFSKMEKTFYPRNSKNEAMSPMTAGFDRETNTTI